MIDGLFEPNTGFTDCQHIVGSAEFHLTKTRTEANIGSVNCMSSSDYFVVDKSRQEVGTN